MTILNAILRPDRGSWQDDALCAEIGGDTWYPDKGQSPKDAKGICYECPVRTQCLQYALDHDERFGVWGGLSETERRKLAAGRPRRPQRTRHIPLDPPTWHPQCGTESGSKKHSREGENSCAACKQASSEARRKRENVRATA